MKWFKHDTDANYDARLLKLRIKYGLEGYGLYWYCLELIATNVTRHNLTFELEHDAEVIAHSTGIHYERVQEMMTYMVNLGLFEQDRGIITCRKMLMRLDQSMTSNPEMRKLIDDAKSRYDSKGHDGVMTVPDSVMQEDRTEDRTEGRTEGRKTMVALATGFDEFWGSYPKKRKKKQALDIWKRKRLNQIAEVIIDDVALRLKTDERWQKGFIPDPTTYLNGERWTDEFTDTTVSRKQSYTDRLKVWMREHADD